jgi:hypothetical protein
MDFATNAPHFIVPELKIIKSLLVVKVVYTSTSKNTMHGQTKTKRSC